MSENAKQHTEKPHSLNFSNGILTLNGVCQVAEISEKEGLFKLKDSTLSVKGSGLNVIKLDREIGCVQLEAQGLTSIVYHRGSLGFKGLFK